VAGRAGGARAERDVVRLCHRGLDTDRLPQQLLQSLRRAVSIDAAFFTTADPETLLFTGAYQEEPLPSAGLLLLDNEFAGEDVNTFTTLAGSAPHVASLDGATRHDRATSPRYRDIMRPLGLGDELRAALVAGTECWGYLCLHREDHLLGFSRSEAALIARLGPHIAHALRQAVLLHRAPTDRDDTGPGVVLLDDALDLVGCTPQAEHLLSLVAHTTRWPLPVPVYAVARALQRLERGTAPAGTLPSVRVLATTGRWLEMHASRLRTAPGEEPVAVVVEQAAPHAAVQILLSAHGLSRREQDVARLVLRGTSTAAISDTLHISRHTVQDHLKSVFDKVGVRSRRDLVGLLLGTPRPGPG
jgi:DNA-binding CsgD family transcriptional regulator